MLDFIASVNVASSLVLKNAKNSDEMITVTSFGREIFSILVYLRCKTYSIPLLLTVLLDLSKHGVAFIETHHSTHWRSSQVEQGALREAFQ